MILAFKGQFLIGQALTKIMDVYLNTKYKRYYLICSTKLLLIVYICITV